MSFKTDIGLNYRDFHVNLAAVFAYVQNDHLNALIACLELMRVFYTEDNFPIKTVDCAIILILVLIRGGGFEYIFQLSTMAM